MSDWKDAPARFVNRLLNRFGLQISRYSDTSIQAAFERLARRPVPVNTVIDIGASDGRWSEKIFRYYPDAFYLLIDANAVYEPALQQFRHRYPYSDYVLAAAGDAEGFVHFYVSDALGGVAITETVPGTIEVPMTTVDTLVKQKGLQPPFLIKLDTHGFEVPILEGACDTLPQTSMVVMETYNFQFTSTNLRFYEMCTYMETRGFRPVDMIDPLHRPLDDALWQFDLMFIRADRDEFKNGLFQQSP
jgi:FkbM family methyltransferase